jgi:hypothetical protein
MNFRAFRQKPLATALTPARQRGPASLGAHAGAKPVLLFASSLGSLECAFHKLNAVAGPN